MAGKFPPETENPFPDAVSELIVTGAVPFEVTVTDFVTAVPTETFPKATDVLLHVSPGTAAFNCKAKLFEVEFEPAVNVAVSAVLTEATAAVKDAVLDPEATVTVAGRVTAAALLDNVTLWPLDEAAPLNVTVHEVDPLPVKALPEHDKAVTDGVIFDVVLALSLIEVLLETDPCVAVRVAV